MKYAVFDWDNTLRKGFTLFAWMDFLYSEKVLDVRVRRRMSKVQKRYADREISHDEYAKLACELYSEEMKGITESIIRKLIGKYMKFDKKDIFPFADGIFEALQEYDVKPIIISGAPSYIVEQYTERFRLHEIYAFSEEFANGFCNGRVAYNYGMNKKDTVELLCSKYGEKPIIGFGDSSSDIPLFDYAGYAFCIVSNPDSRMHEEKPFGRRVNYVSSKSTARQMRNTIEHILNPRKI